MNKEIWEGSYTDSSSSQTQKSEGKKVRKLRWGGGPGELSAVLHWMKKKANIIRLGGRIGSKHSPAISLTKGLDG